MTDVRSNYDPWADLAGRDHIAFTRHPVAEAAGGALYARAGRRALIVLSPRLRREERRAALAHELVHDERGVLDGPPLIMAKEEAKVRRVAAERLVPSAELRAFIERHTSGGGQVTAAMVAEEFDVPVGTAVEALRRLT